MLVLYSVVSRGNTILAEYASCTGNFTEAIEQILANIPEHNDKLTVSHENHLFHYIKENGIVYMCITDNEFDQLRAFLFLHDIKRLFLSSYGEMVETLNSEFSRILANEMKHYSEYRDIGTTSSVHTKLDELKDTDNVTTRGEPLEFIVMTSRIKSCCVPGCIPTDVRRHAIPKHVKIREVWLERIGNEKLLTIQDNYELLKNYRICGGHFDERCKNPNGTLIPLSLPTLLLPNFDGPSNNETCFLRLEEQSHKYVTPEKLREALKSAMASKQVSEVDLKVETPVRTFVKSTAKKRKALFHEGDPSDEPIPSTSKGIAEPIPSTSKGITQPIPSTSWGPIQHLQDQTAHELGVSPLPPTASQQDPTLCKLRSFN